MPYLFAGLCLFPNLCLLLVNKFTTNKHNEYVVAFLKGFFYIFLAFGFLCIMGHVGNVFDAFKETRTTIFLLLNALSMGISWALYFFAIKRSPLGLFNCIQLCNGVLFTSILSFILSIDIVTNGKKPLNVALYIIALCMMIGMNIATFFNKESKEKGSRFWIFILMLAGLVSAINNLIFMNKELPSNVVPEDVIIFYQAIGITIVNLLIVCVSKQTGDIKTVKTKEYVFIAISSLCELGYYFLYDLALNKEGSNHAIVTIIAYAGFFFLVELVNILILKKKPSLFHGIMLLVFLTALILACLAGSI